MTEKLERVIVRENGFIPCYPHQNFSAYCLCFNPRKYQSLVYVNETYRSGLIIPFVWIPSYLIMESRPTTIADLLTSDDELLRRYAITREALGFKSAIRWLYLYSKKLNSVDFEEEIKRLTSMLDSKKKIK